MLQKKYSHVFLTGLQGAKARHWYKKRRQALLRRLDAPLLLSGVRREPGTEHFGYWNRQKVYQDQVFLYLTGINQTGCRLLLDPRAANPADREVLFVPNRNPRREFWTGARLGLPKTGNTAAALRELRQLTGFSRVQWEGEFFRTVASCLRRAGKGPALVHFYRWWNPQKRRYKTLILDPSFLFFRECREKIRIPRRRWRCGLDKIQPPMEILDGWQVRELKNAIRVTGRTFHAILRQLRRFADEGEIGRAVEQGLLATGSTGPAFAPIVAGGANATTLHYEKNDEPLRAGSLILLDFGAAGLHACADLSRTIPYSGRFNPLQRLVYEAVLAASVFHQAQVRAGATLRDLDRKVWEFLDHRLHAGMREAGGTFKLLYKRRPHGVSHLIAAQVHAGDPARIYYDQPLRPGMVISNEPGAYGHFRLRHQGKIYDETLGIRIEDDLLVTRTGCVNLTAGIPKRATELEGIISGKV